MTEITMVTAVVIILATILVLMFRAVFSRPSSGRSQDSSEHGGSPVPNTSPVIESSSSSLSSEPLTPIPNTSSAIESSSPGSWNYDVFLSFRGEDVRKNFVDHLYNALVDRTVLTYKDDETLPRGDTIGPALLKAIQESHIALIVFSKNYADSSWCLDELAYIMKCKEERGQIVIPIFYDVDPSDVRKQKGQFGQAFSKHNSANNDNVESWKKALVDASNIAGWETKLVANGHEAKCINEIVGSVLDKLLSFNSFIDENLVGMGTRLQDLKSDLEIGSGGVRMVGIWGVGGGGKTTLATSLYMEISANFDGCCFVENIREESSQHNGLKNLQEKILSKVLKTQVEVESGDIGQHMIKSRLCSRNVLIVLDDVDDVGQLEALAGSHDWFGDGSRIIITTRNQHVLISHGVDVVSPITLLSRDEAIRLFRRYAYHKNNPVEDYNELSSRVISYVKGLPLALKIIGSFLKGKDTIQWNSALEKLKDNPNGKVMEQLKISYNGLDRNERELFLDIACFFRGKSKEKAMEILDACGFHPSIGIQVLRQKALITITDYGNIDMHDLVQEMGHHIVRGKHPNNPEKHSRLWRSREVSEMCSGNATMENHKIEAIQYSESAPQSSSFITLLSNLKKLRFLDVSIWGDSCCDEGPTFLSNELKYMHWYRYPSSLFPESFQPRKLVVLKLGSTLQKELWKGKKYMPCLKELKLMDANALVRTPDIGGLSSLKKLTIKNCESLEEIHQSLGNHASLVYVSISSCKKLTRFSSIVRMEKLEILEISSCHALLEFPKIEANMDSLANLTLEYVGIEVLPSSVGRYCTNLISLKLEGCSELKSIEGNFHALKHLQKFKLAGFTQLEKNPKDLFNEKCFLEELLFDLKSYSESNNLRPNPPHLPRLLRKLNLSGFELKDGEIPREIGELSNLQELHLCGNHFSRLDFSLSQLTRLKLLNLSDCHKLVELPELPSNLSILQADNCDSLEAIGDDIYSNCKWLSQVSIKSDDTYSNFEWLSQVSVRSDGEGCGSLVGGVKLLESMLQGMAIGNHQCMSLLLKGIEIPKGFEPRLLRGNKCRLKLPKNWFNEYTGFLFCSVLKKCERIGSCIRSVKIKMWQKVVHIGMGDYQVFWEQESVNDGLSKYDTKWFETTYESPIRGFRARLVSKKNQMEETTTTTNSSSEISDDDYTCKFKIKRDSRSLLKGQFDSRIH